jgi:hypothetical protein
VEVNSYRISDSYLLKQALWFNVSSWRLNSPARVDSVHRSFYPVTLEFQARILDVFNDRVILSTKL